ncbi:MAG: hypothetical protein H6839_17590 [Planctomycetes bacterium]|nr:hypothetical protein [Planctomycetota bacterium]
MYDVLPDTLAHAQRGICPTCGAPMKLAESGREARCDFCGGGSQLKFSLRAIEPDAAALAKPTIKGATRWIEKQAKYEDVNCPGCGATFQANTGHSIQTCKYCGAQSKLETRLVPITTDDVPEPAERTRADFQNASRDRIDHPWDIETEQLFWRVLHEPDLTHRRRLAINFRRWSYINHTAAHFLPWLLKEIETGDQPTSLAASDVIGKLLCEGDPTLWPGVIQACRGVVFDANARACVLHELGLGKGVCVKTLIDTAEFAAAHGANDYACNALWAVNTLIERNFDEHPVIAQIVLYRLFFVTGPVLGWALYTMRNGYLRGRYPIEYLVRAIEELSIERPQLVEHLLDCIYVGGEGDGEFNKRLDFVRKAQSWGARAAGFEMLYQPAEDPALMAEAIALIDADLDDEHAGTAAEGALYRLITTGKKTGPAIDDLVRKRGESLSYRVKREYIRYNPETPLLDTSVQYYWQSDPKREFDPEMQAQLDAWRELIRDSVDKYRKNVEEMRVLLRESDKLDVPIFLREEPATIPLSAKYLEAEQKVAKAEKRQVDQTKEMQRLQEEYQKAMEQLSQKMMANMQDAKVMQQVTAEMQRLSAELQEKMQKLFGN